MSTVKVDTLVASDGTSPVTLTKQSAAKHYIAYDGTTLGVVDSINTTSITDIADGNHRYNFVNSFAATAGYTVGGVLAFNGDNTSYVYINQPINKADLLTSSAEMVSVYSGSGGSGSQDYTITNGRNAMSAGPITVNTGVTVTVGTGETWTVV